MKTNEDLKDALKQYIYFMKAGEYFVAHEVLEEGWHPLRLRKDPIANFVKGLINAAISFEHIKRDKKDMVRKAKTVMLSYEKYKDIDISEEDNYLLFVDCIELVETKKEEFSDIFK